MVNEEDIVQQEAFERETNELWDITTKAESLALTLFRLGSRTNI